MRNIFTQYAGVNGKIINPLLRLFNERVAVKLPAQSIGIVINLFQRLVKGHSPDGRRCITDNPFARIMNVRAGGKVHHGIRTPERGPAHFLDLFLNGRSERRVAYIRVNFGAELPTNNHRLRLRMVNVERNHRAAGGYFCPHKFRFHLLTDRHIFHFGRNDARPGIAQLSDRPPRLRAQRLALQPMKCLSLIRKNFHAGAVLLHIAALADPCGTDRRKPAFEVRFVRGVGIRPAHIVEAEIFIVSVQLDFAKRNAQVGTRTLFIDFFRPRKIFAVTTHKSVIHYQLIIIRPQT